MGWKESGGSITITKDEFDPEYFNIPGLGSYFICNSPNGAMSSASAAPDSPRAVPMPLTRKSTIEKIGFNVVTAGVASLSKIAIYDSDPTNFLPKNKLWESAVFDTTTTGIKEEVANLTLNAGLYWGVVLSNVATTQPVLSQASNYFRLLGNTTSGTAYRAYQGTATYPNFTNPFGAGSITGNNAPSVLYTVSVVF